jgi:hypothetical protein
MIAHISNCLSLVRVRLRWSKIATVQRIIEEFLAKLADSNDVDAAKTCQINARFCSRKARMSDRRIPSRSPSSIAMRPQVIKLESAHSKKTRGIRKLDIDFQKRTFATSGPNGSGKSVIVAITWAHWANRAASPGGSTSVRCAMEEG